MSGSNPDARQIRHPGAAGGRARTRPKGRQISPDALAEIQTLLGDRPRRRDLLIEFMHLIQDQYRALSAKSLLE